MVSTDAEESVSKSFGLGVVIISQRGKFAASYSITRNFLEEIKVVIKLRNIYCLELLAALLGRCLSNNLHDKLPQRNEIAFIDNEGVRLSIIKGFSKRA
jgi:hypothetical protein